MGRSFRAAWNCSMTPSSAFGVLAVRDSGSVPGLRGFDERSEPRDLLGSQRGKDSRTS